MRCIPLSILAGGAALAALAAGASVGAGARPGAAPPPGTAGAAVAAGAPAQDPRGAAPDPAERLNPLLGLVRRSDAIVEGRIEHTRAFALDPGDGAPMVLTEVVVRGRLLGGTAIASAAPSPPLADDLHSFLVHGGLLEGGLEGSFVPDAPARHELRVGRGVIVFCADTHALMATGPDLDGRMPLGGRAGLFNTFVARSGEVIVQGRGLGSALPVNLTLRGLRERIARLAGPPTEDDR